MTIVLFEDRQVTQLYPITIGRPAFAISCGSFRLIDLAAQLGHEVRALVRPHLREVFRADFNGAAAEPATRGGLALVNARLTPSAATLGKLRKLLDAGRAGVVRADQGAGPLAFALLPRDATLPGGDVDGADIERLVDEFRLPALEERFSLFSYPHDVIRDHLATLNGNLEHRLAHGDYQELRDGVFVADGATIGEHVVSDSGPGPIVLEAGAAIGPYCYLRGPAHLGVRARVIEHAAIKDCVALGHTTKIGGEVEGSVIEPYTNKQHHGFLGHSYLGSWVNLGAGTCNSDLKNTYGKVNMEYNGQKVPTDMQFVGAIVGDYAKTAINTGIFTGKTIGACSMVYGFVTTNVPSFVNYARLFGQVTEAPVEVMAATQARMFARRSVEQRPCDVQLLHAMYELTRHERQLAGEPLSL